MKSRRRIDWTSTVQQEGPCGYHPNVFSHRDDEKKHPLLAERKHRRVGSGWLTESGELILHRVAASQGRAG